MNAVGFRLLAAQLKMPLCPLPHAAIPAVAVHLISSWGLAAPFPHLGGSLLVAHGSFHPRRLLRLLHPAFHHPPQLPLIHCHILVRCPELADQLLHSQSRFGYWRACLSREPQGGKGRQKCGARLLDTREPETGVLNCGSHLPERDWTYLLRSLLTFRDHSGSGCLTSLARHPALRRSFLPPRNGRAAREAYRPGDESVRTG